jgi:hypothetical protein
LRRARAKSIGNGWLTTLSSSNHISG